MHPEKPDRFGRAFLAGVGIWGAVGVVVFVCFRIAFPDRGPIANKLEIAAVATSGPVEPACKPSVPSGGYDPADASDPLQRVIHVPSRCAPAANGSDPTELLHAYLDDAELDGSPRAPSPTVDDALKARGGVLYQDHCANCHGKTGEGNGADACALDPQATNHRKGVFALRTTEHEALPTDEDLFRTITRGIHGTAMPPWFALPESDRWALVAYVKTLSKQFEEDSAPPPMESTPAPAATPARLAAGRELFAKGGCASCHGDTGHGNGAAASALPIRPRDFTGGRFHRATTVAAIHETLLTGLDGTPMASFAKVMSPDDLWNVSLFVHTFVPPTTDVRGLRCPETPHVYNTQELIGARSLLRTMHDDIARSSAPDAPHSRKAD